MNYSVPHSLLFPKGIGKREHNVFQSVNSMFCLFLIEDNFAAILEHDYNCTEIANMNCRKHFLFHLSFLEKTRFHVVFLCGKNGRKTSTECSYYVSWGDDVFFPYSFFIIAEEFATSFLVNFFCAAAVFLEDDPSCMHARQFLHCRGHSTAHARTHTHHTKRRARTSIFHPLGENSSSREFVKGGLLFRQEYSIWFTRQTLRPRWELLISGYAPRCLRLYMALVYRRRSLWLMSKWWFIGSYLNIPGRDVGDRRRDGKGRVRDILNQDIKL